MYWFDFLDNTLQILLAMTQHPKTHEYPPKTSDHHSTAPDVVHFQFSVGGFFFLVPSL
jgi:hypothetical protein